MCCTDFRKLTFSVQISTISHNISVVYISADEADNVTLFALNQTHMEVTLCSCMQHLQMTFSASLLASTASLFFFLPPTELLYSSVNGSG